MDHPALGEPYVLVASVAREYRNGPDQHILNAVAEALGATVIFRYAPFKRRLLMMENGDIDMVCSLLKRTKDEDFKSPLTNPLPPI